MSQNPCKCWRPIVDKHIFLLLHPWWLPRVLGHAVLSKMLREVESPGLQVWRPHLWAENAWTVALCLSILAQACASPLHHPASPTTPGASLASLPSGTYICIPHKWINFLSAMNGPRQIRKLNMHLWRRFVHRQLNVPLMWWELLFFIRSRALRLNPIFL